MWGALIPSPSGKRVRLAPGAHRCLELSDLGGRKASTIITSLLIPPPHRGCRAQSYPTPSPNLPSSSLTFPHFILKSPEQMHWGKWREHCDFLHPKSTRNDQSWLVRGKLNDIQNYAENRNCRQDDRHKIYDSLQRVSFQARKTTTTSYC